jgi:hypothetical protein
MLADPSLSSPEGPARRPRRVSPLSPWQTTELRAFAEAFFADEDGPPSDPHLDNTLDELGQLIAHAGARSQLLFGASVLTMAFLVPALLLGRFRRFSRLSFDERLEALHRSERSPAGLAVFLLRALTSIVFYEHPDGARAIRWDQRCLTAPPRGTAT